MAQSSNELCSEWRYTAIIRYGTVKVAWFTIGLTIDAWRQPNIQRVDIEYEGSTRENSLYQRQSGLHKWTKLLNHVYAH